MIQFMNRALIVLVLLVILVLLSVAHGGCGISINGMCDGDDLIYCEFGIKVTIKCAILGKICGIEKLFGFFFVYVCVDQNNICDYKDCGSGCGICSMGQSCNAVGQCIILGSCVLDCSVKECGPDGCGNDCNNGCSAGSSCIFNFVCVENSVCQGACNDRECGINGCGGYCGFCQGDESCDYNYKCVKKGGCEVKCSGKVCGSDGCGVYCGFCAADESCNFNY